MDSTRVPRIQRGGVTAIVAWVLIGIGVIGFLMTIQFSSSAIATSLLLGIPAPSLISDLSPVFVAVWAGLVGGAILLLGFSGAERDREEQNWLDPLRYVPFHRPWRRVIPWSVLVITGMVIFGLFAVPVPQSFHLQFPVSSCTSGGSGIPSVLKYPAGTILAYHWSSSNGQPVGEVWAPSGAQISSNYSNWSSTLGFFNSSYGNSVWQSNGTALTFWACDFSATTPRNESIDVSGTLYRWVL